MVSLVELLQQIDRWFFDYQVSSVLIGVMRALAIAVVLAQFSVQFGDIIRYSKPFGVFNTDAWLNACKSFPQMSLYSLFPQSHILPWIVTLGAFISGFLALIGLLTWLTLPTFLVSVVSIQGRTFTIMFSGGDSVVRMLLLCLALTDSSAALSVDTLLSSKPELSTVPGWPLRILQIYVCSIYWNSACYKIYRQCWISGHAVRDAAMSGLWGRRIGLSLFSNQFFSKWFSRSVLIFESTAPITFWITETTVPTLVAALLLHGSLWLFLRIGYFGPIMMVSVLAFGNPLVSFVGQLSPSKIARISHENDKYFFHYSHS